MTIDRKQATKHIYFSTFLPHSQAAYKWFKCILKSFLWGKQGEAKGLPMVTWYICKLLRDQRALGLPDKEYKGQHLMVNG